MYALTCVDMDSVLAHIESSEVTLCRRIQVLCCVLPGSSQDLASSRVVIFPILSRTCRDLPRIQLGYINMKAACIVAFLTFSALEASAEIQPETQPAGTEAEAAEACQSGSLIQQRLGSPHTVLPVTEATPDLETATAKTLKPLEKKKLQKRKKLEKLQKFLAESKMQVRGPPKGSECHPTGALLLMPSFCCMLCSVSEVLA